MDDLEPQPFTEKEIEEIRRQMETADRADMSKDYLCVCPARGLPTAVPPPVRIFSTPPLETNPESGDQKP